MSESPGAVDLGTAAATGNGAPSSRPVVVDVTEATFQQEVVERSAEIPVVIDFWAAWCGPCRQLSPILEKLAVEGGGRWALAKIDVDSNQRLSSAAGVQGIPAVKAVIGGQIVGEFTGALPESQVRQWIDSLLKAAADQGFGVPADGAAPEADPLETAYAALAAGDLDAAEAELNAVLAKTPNDAAAKAGLAQIALLRRTESVDEGALAAAAAANPDAVEANLAVADLDVLSGNAEAAFTRLIGLIRRLDGDDREQVKTHLIGLFDALDPGDPVVLRARRELANALF
jgi:putative thioredoxin